MTSAKCFDFFTPSLLPLFSQNHNTLCQKILVIFWPTFLPHSSGRHLLKSPFAGWRKKSTGGKIARPPSLLLHFFVFYGQCHILGRFIWRRTSVERAPCAAICALGRGFILYRIYYAILWHCIVLFFWEEGRVEDGFSTSDESNMSYMSLGRFRHFIGRLLAPEVAGTPLSRTQ